MNAGDKIILAGDAGQTNIDYFLLEKTANLASDQNSEAFEFTKTASELSSDAKVTVLFQKDGTGSIGGKLTEPFGTEFSGQGAVQIAVVVTGIRNGYSVKSVTIE